MAHKRFQQELTIAAPYAFVQHQLAELRHNIHAHDPYATEATLLQRETDRGLIIEDYSVRDRIGSRPIALTFRYRTRITLDEHHVVTFDTHLPAGIRLQTRQWCTSDTLSHTHICDVVDVTAPRILLATVYSGVATAQTRLFARLKEALEMHARSSVE
ncbi:hypothetical protein ACWDUL_20565 [Nocardia niigatensis]